MNTLKKLSLALALTFIFALSCGALMADELVVIASETQLATDGVSGWLNALAQMGVTTRLATAADFEAVKTSPFLAVLVSPSDPDNTLNSELLPLVVTDVLLRSELGTGGNRKLLCYENKFAEGQLLMVFSSPAINGMRAGTIFNENEDEWRSRLSVLVP